MKHRYGWSLLVAAAVIAFVALPGTRTTAGNEGRIMFDLEDLADGETRTFGEGEHAVTATRNGDTVSIRIAGEDGVLATARTIDCELGQDQCNIMVTTGDEQMIMLSTGGELTWTDAHEGDMHLPHGAQVVFVAEDDGEAGDQVVTKDVRVIRLKGDGHAEGDHDVLVSVAGAGEFDFTSAQGLGKAFAFHVGDHGRTLRCPEGDTTMNLGKDDDETYYCPKHDVELEQLEEGNVSVKKIHVVTKSDDDE